MYVRKYMDIYFFLALLRSENVRHTSYEDYFLFNLFIFLRFGRWHNRIMILLSFELSARMKGLEKYRMSDCVDVKNNRKKEPYMYM